MDPTTIIVMAAIVVVRVGWERLGRRRG